jgi:hypothetical protein
VCPELLRDEREREGRRDGVRGKEDGRRRGGQTRIFFWGKEWSEGITV